jgi:acyl-CoA thioester hydrolase
LIVVAEASCRYKSPARFDDLLVVRTRVTRADKRMLRFAYEVLRQPSDDLLATAETTHVICDHHGRPKSLPEKYRKYFLPGHSDGAPHSDGQHGPVSKGPK